MIRDAQFLAPARDRVQHAGGVFHSLKPLLALRADGMFGSGMNDEIADLQQGGGFGGLQNFLQGPVALIGTQRGDVDVVGEQRASSATWSISLMTPRPWRESIACSGIRKTGGSFSTLPAPRMASCGLGLR